MLGISTFNKLSARHWHILKRFYVFPICVRVWPSVTRTRVERTVPDEGNQEDLAEQPIGHGGVLVPVTIRDND